MPNATGQILLDAEGRRLLDPQGRLSCRCCTCDPCPDGLASAYNLNADFTAPLFGVVGNHDVTVNRVGTTCRWEGEVPSTSGPAVPVWVQRITADPIVACGWEADHAFAGRSYKEGGDPTGSYTLQAGGSSDFVMANVVVS